MPDSAALPGSVLNGWLPRRGGNARRCLGLRRRKQRQRTAGSRNLLRCSFAGEVNGHVESLGQVAVGQELDGIAGALDDAS